VNAHGLKARWVRPFLLASLWAAFIGFPFASAADEQARQVIADAGNEMIRVVAERRAELNSDPAELYQLVEDILLPHFDFQTISRLVLGKYWRTASASQRTRFMEAFRNLLVRSYATAWLEYEGQELRFLPPRPSSKPDRTVVRLELVEPYGSPVAFTYSLHNTSGPWLVYDVAVDGISLLTNYRASIATNVKAQGLDITIEDIEKRNQDALAQ